MPASGTSASARPPTSRTGGAAGALAAAWAARPDLSPWIHSLKVFGAAMLALYAALALGLPRPYWALATVYLVSSPLAGATYAKGTYRVAGTLLGALCAVALVPLLIDKPVMLMAAIACWTGALLYLSLLEPAPRNYICLLAAYTLPIVALPTVTSPGTVFAVALTRIEEIAIGIICASVVSAVVFPVRTKPALAARVSTWLTHASRWIQDMLGTGASPARRHDSFSVLAADIVAMETLLAQLAYETDGAPALRHARALHQRMAALLPRVLALADTVAALRRSPEGLPDAVAQRLRATVAWIAGAPGASRPLYACRPAGSTPAATADWHARLVAAASEYLDELADLWQDCRLLQASLRQGGTEPAVLRYRVEPAGQARHHDHARLLFRAATAGTATFVAGLLWMASGWVDGAGPVGLAALASCFIAAADQPRLMAGRVVVWSVACALLAWYYQFVVLVLAHDFSALALLLFWPYLVIGALTTQSRYALFGVLLAVTSASFAGMPQLNAARFVDIFNSSLASLAALCFAALWAALMQPFGRQLVAYRLARVNWSEIALAAHPRALVNSARLRGRMLDRLLRQWPPVAGRHRTGGSVAAFQVESAVLALRRACQDVPASRRRILERALAGVARHYRHCSHAGHELAPAPALAARIDAAWAALAEPSESYPSAALAALVSLRLALYPPGTLTNGGRHARH
ncbi:p-hydroxybenzoic acid efflux pump subunit AaeB [Cupriavidus laharis]|uniref:p-hydroxybenzoic acid efflux pump subunit AaeB n=1 Tax=Cupriavidus laharis TaxID=151654 RepID=A0ABN7ZFS7_9BURK|nr:FUSC family protein [Cupriavidus laharis]CAG9183161.1 p-hydroxybenzoic acid efflux pump subunit AaeB [Cupriavidus laharis]